jgi:hypothetical protein
MPSAGEKLDFRWLAQKKRRTISGFEHGREKEIWLYFNWRAFSIEL